MVAVTLVGSARANPRAAAEMGGEMTPDAPMDVWLRRLVGRYSFDGAMEVVRDGGCGNLPPDPGAEEVEPTREPACRTIKGKGDCVAVGDGPGVHCVLGVRWLDIFARPGGVSYLDPAMALFGLDPGKSAFSYLLVDHKGLPEGGLGQIKGNRATFETLYVNAPALFMEMNLRAATNCYRTIRIDAKPDGNVIHWSMDIEIEQEGVRELWTRFEMTLRRVQPQEVTGDAVAGRSS